MARQLVPVPFAEGVERSDGALLVRASSFRDLRNVHLTGSRMEIRRGIESKALVSGGVTDVLAIHPMRAALQSVVVCYDSATREVTLQRATIDPNTLAVTLTAVPGVLWTIPVTAPFPVVSITDSYGKAYIAHNESSHALRQNTKVFDPSTATWTDLLYDQDPLAPMQFRGVHRWLSYVVGWGYGTPDTGPPDDRNRPEVARVSLPGDPDVFDPNFYFIVGQRGEPVVGAAQTAMGLVFAKESELHLVTGTSQLDFDINMIDPAFGAVTGASMIEVNGRVYFWSAEGPRYTDGSASLDAAVSLDLRGPQPDALLSDADLRSCFAAFRPDREEIEWVFPAAGRNASWAFVLDLKDPQGSKWHYRPYGQLIRCAGLLAGNVAFDPGDPLVAPYISLTDFDANAGTYYGHNAAWANTNVANLPAGSVVEIWGAAGPGPFEVDAGVPWTLIKSVAASGATQSDASITIGTPGTAQEFRHLAVRYRLADGTYYAAQQSSNPMDWPANTRLTLLAGARPEIANTAAAWGGTPDVTTPITVSWLNDDPDTLLDGGTEVEVWGMGSETLGGPGIAPDEWQLEATVTVSGSSQSQPGVVIGQQRRHVALRYKQSGEYYAHSQHSDPWQWPAASRASLLLDGPRPILSFAWDVVSGIPRSPGTLTITYPDASLAAAGTWEVEIYRAVWDSGKAWLPTAVPSSEWVLESQTTFPGSQPPPSSTLVVSTLNSQFKLIFAARLKRGGSAAPSTYSSSNPSDWPSVSRLIVDCI